MLAASIKDDFGDMEKTFFSISSAASIGLLLLLKGYDAQDTRAMIGKSKLPQTNRGAVVNAPVKYTASTIHQLPQSRGAT
jgi:hypothetical protein